MNRLAKEGLSDDIEKVDFFFFLYLGNLRVPLRGGVNPGEAGESPPSALAKLWVPF